MFYPQPMMPTRNHLLFRPHTGLKWPGLHTKAYKVAGYVYETRRQLVNRRAAEASGWLRVSDWEVAQEGWSRTR